MTNGTKSEVRTHVEQQPDGSLKVYLYSQEFDAIAGPRGKRLALEAAQQAGLPRAAFTKNTPVYPVDEQGREITDLTKKAAFLCCEYTLVQQL